MDHPGPTPPLVPRRALDAVNTALSESRVVLVQGARQAGKSTLVRLIAQARGGARTYTLDDQDLRRAADADPKGFVESSGLLVIDEVQRSPELLLAIKMAVDTDPRPGQYLLTGSSRVLSMRSVPDTLPGRMQTVELWPFSQGEIDSTPDGFVAAAFRHGDRLRHESSFTRRDYAARLVRGGFPEAVARPTPASARRFLTDYLDTLLEREVTEIAEVAHLPQLRQLVGALAARSGGLLVLDPIARDLQIAPATVRRYLGLLEEVFVVKRIPAWSRNLNTRAVATPKVVLVDSGVAAAVLAQDEASLLEPANPGLGPLTEGFVAAELLRQLSWLEEPIVLRHYRTRHQVEVDLVLEHARGQVVAVEVKGGASVGAGALRGLRHLADRLGDQFRVGIVLYAGQQTLSFGPKLLAMPISALWQLSAD
ncbi:MAG: ATP-binding protein [Natronosporangium sp.]